MKDDTKKTEVAPAPSPAGSKTAPAKPRQPGDVRRWLDSMEYMLEFVLKNQGSEQATAFVDGLFEG